jgi:hypothetical protein
MKNTARRSGLSALVPVAVVLSLGSSGCKKDPPPVPVAADSGSPGKAGVLASCDMTTEVGSCTEYAKLSMGLEKGLCTGLKGKFVEGKGAGCPTANEVGQCTMTDGEVKHYYGVAVGPHGYTAVDAQKDCVSPEIGGKFSSQTP